MFAVLVFFNTGVFERFVTSLQSVTAKYRLKFSNSLSLPIMVNVPQAYDTQYLLGLDSEYSSCMTQL